jgi:hypothetical protein
MQRKSKSFSVEIKKSRVPGQRHPLSPKRSFKTRSAEATPISEKEEPQAVAEPAVARRLLPSLIKTMQVYPEPVVPVRRSRSSALATRRSEKELEPSEPASKEAEPAQALIVPEAVPQAGYVTVTVEHAWPVHEAEPRESLPPEPSSATTKSRGPRIKTPRVGEPAMVAEPSSDSEVTQPSLTATSTISSHRLTKRQAAAEQLPRHERWKRRLHPATW